MELSDRNMKMGNHNIIVVTTIRNIKMKGGL